MVTGRQANEERRAADGERHTPDLEPERRTAHAERRTTQSGVYIGTLRHRRFSPLAHEFTYPLFMVLLDVDRIADLMGASRFTSRNRFNWATFADRDHLGDPKLPLRERLAADAARNGVELPAGPILLLTHLRYLGYCFNPVSFFYCFDGEDHLQLVLAEVNNTFGGSHNYWLRPFPHSIPRFPDSPIPRFSSSASKSLYVSPFIEADVDYTFAFTRPGESLVAHMETRKDGETFFDATLTLDRREWSATQIRHALVRHPLMTASVIAGIHWEALRLWRKGVPIVPRPTADGSMGERRPPNAPGTTHAVR
jgi:DUF1365 family protein